MFAYDFPLLVSGHGLFFSNHDRKEASIMDAWTRQMLKLSSLSLFIVIVTMIATN